MINIASREIYEGKEVRRMSFREKMARFMVQRNGMDELARFESGLAMILLLVSLFSRLNLLYLVSLVVLIHMYFRMFSKNRSKRYAENQRYVTWRYQTLVKWNKWKTRLVQRKQYKFFKCPMCKQKVRVPRGHGKIEISCPKCRERFIRRS